jgi:hypothetical protein
MIYDGFPSNFAILQHVQYATLKKRLDKVEVSFIKTSIDVENLYGGGGPCGVGIEVEFPLVILPVMLPAIVLLLAWLPWIVVCASADIAPKFIDASTPATNIPIATIVTPNLLFCM